MLTEIDYLKCQIKIKLLKLYVKLKDDYKYINEVINMINVLLMKEYDTYSSILTLSYSNFISKLDIDNWTISELKDINIVISNC